MKVKLKSITNKKEILELMDCKENINNYELFSSIYDEVLKENIDIINPIGYYNYFDNKDYIKEDCDKVVFCIVTIGKEIDVKIKEYFDKFDYLKGMILSSIGDYILFQATNELYKVISLEAKTKKINLTKRYEPGCSNIDIKMQKTILEYINKFDDTGMDISSGYMLIPTKSTAYFYGIGSRIDYTSIDHDCSKCDNINCNQRKYLITIKTKEKEETFEVRKNTNLLTALRENNIPIDAYCSGNKICGKCKIKVINKKLKISERERKFLTEKEINEGFVLACFHEVNEPLVLEKESSETNIKITSNFEIEKIVDKKYKFIKVSDIEKKAEGNLSATELINQKIKGDYKFSLNAIRQLSNIESLNSQFYCLVKNENYVENVTTDIKKKVYGFAIDIGTTTIAITLINLLNGNSIDTYKSNNPQKTYGADVISRINFAYKDSKNTLTSLIHSELIEGMEKLIKQNNINTDDIYEIAIAGNTTMLYLLAGINPYKLSISPFLTMDLNIIKTSFCNIFNSTYLNCNVTILPGISAYVGADILAGFYMIDLQKQKGNYIFIDIGTNGEMAIKVKDKIICVATAAGPAFEGANIKCGMGSIEGAICNVWYENGEYRYNFIGNDKPKGICGSGLIDIVAAALENKQMTKDGRINNDEKKIKLYKDSETEISIYQQDIRQVQLAKAAIAAGIEVLIEEGNCNLNEISNLYLAGGFGSNLNIQNAVKIGLLPKELANKTKIIGNSSLGGCVKYLLENNAEEKFNDIKKKCEYIELSTDIRFNERYIMNMNF